MDRRTIRAAILACVSALLAVLGVSVVYAQTITNTAQANWTQSGRTLRSLSNAVAFDVTALPIPTPTPIQTYINRAYASQSLEFSPSSCGGAQLGAGAVKGLGTTVTASVNATTSLQSGDVIYFSVTAPQMNANSSAVDSLVSDLTTSNGDRETIQIFETGPNTGVFVGAMPTAGTLPALMQNDCRLSVVSQGTISIAVRSGSTATPFATASLDVRADPFGTVFDSEDGTPVSGAIVSIVDAVTGAPAEVLAPDGQSSWPSSMVSGQSVTDGAGNVYPMAAGEYRFPLLAPGDHRIVVVPPTPYSAPSGASMAQLAALTGPNGPFIISDASFGRSFALASLEAAQVDVPVDRPGVAVTLTKAASRTRAEPGEAVFYTITVTNPDTRGTKRGVKLVDTPSDKLRLRRDSIRIDGEAAQDAATVSPDGSSLSIALGSIAPGGSRRVTYAMTVRPDAPSGEAVNKVTATDGRGLAAIANAVVKIDLNGLTSRMTLVGRVTAGGCTADAARLGIPDVRVMLEDGSFAVTDSDGRYHFDGVVPGSHVAAVLDATLPEGGKFVNCGQSTRNAGSATSRFVSGQGGSLAVADFYATLPEPAMQDLRAWAEKAEESRREPVKAASPASGVEAPDTVGTEPDPDTLDDSARSDRAAAGADADWLAMGDGPPAFLFPAIDYNPRAPTFRVVVRHEESQRVELLAEGKPVADVSFDGLKKSANGQWAVSIWRGIPIEGDVAHLAAVVRNADGTEVARLTRDVHFTATAADVRLLPEQSRLVADGRTRPVIAVRIVDRTGRPVHSGISGEFQINAPYESAEAIDAMQSRALTGMGRSAPHWTVKGDDGIALIELAPTMASGAVQLDFVFSDGRQKRRQSLNAWMVPGEQKWTLVGLAEGSAGARSVADAMERTGRFDSDLGDDVRTAFYAKGRILGSTLLTVAYDSGKQRDDQQLQGAVDPRAYYTVFADRSDRRFDAASRNKLYVRIESRAFNAVFGDFEAGLNQTQLTRYQRIATGIKAEARLGNIHAQGFATDVASGHQHDELQGSGLTGPYRLSNKSIIANSENVKIEVRDRFRSELIVDTRLLTRFIDYDIDMLAGTITFKEPILSRDSSQNPQFIIIDYDVDENSSSSALNAGGRIDYTSTDGVVRLGATMVSDTGNGPRTDMAGVDAKVRIGDATELRAELAGSRAEGRTHAAWLVEAEHHDGKLDVLAYAREMEQGYGVGQNTRAEQGRRKYGMDARLSVTDQLSVTASGWIDDSLTDAAHRDAVAVHGEYRAGRDSYRLGISAIRDHLIDGSTAASTVIDGGVTRRMLDDKLEVDGAVSIGLGDTDSVDLPSRYQLTLRYAVTSDVKLIGSYEIANGSALDARTGRVGFEVSPWRGMRVKSALGSQDITEYGKRSFAAFGLAQSLELTDHLTLDGSVDSNRVLSGIDPTSVVNPEHPVASGGHLGENGSIAEDFTALTLGASWRAERWSATVRGEYRDGEFANRQGVTLGIIRQLGDGTVVGSGFAWTRATGIDATATEIFDGAVALALRPANSPFAALAKLEVRSDWIAGAKIGVIGDAGSTALAADGEARAARVIASLSVNWSPAGRDNDTFVQRSEFGLFTAVRYNVDRENDYDLSATALLGGVDAHFGIGERFEIGGSVTVRTTLSDNVTQFAIGPSVGVVPTQDVLLTVGYNVAGYRDRDFSGARNTTSGVFAALKAKFDVSTIAFLGLPK